MTWAGFFRKGNKGSLRTRAGPALTSEQECTAGRSGGRIPSGGGCAGPGGSRRTCSAPPGFPQTCSRRRARSPESWCWWSSGAWRCPREQRVRHRPWELHWEAKQTQGEALQILPGSHLASATACSRLLLAGGLSSAGGRQVSEGNAVPAMEEQQNAHRTTKWRLHNKHQSTLLWKSASQSENYSTELRFLWFGWVLFFFNFLAAVLSLKKTTSRHSWGKQRPSLGLNAHQESLHLK